MKLKVKALYQDLKAVLLKHFRPDPDTDPTEVKLLKMIVALQKQQKDMNGIRNSLGESVKLLDDSEILEEFDRLRKLAPAESGETVARPDTTEDRMFS